MTDIRFDAAFKIKLIRFGIVFFPLVKNFYFNALVQIGLLAQMVNDRFPIKFRSLENSGVRLKNNFCAS